MNRPVHLRSYALLMAVMALLLVRVGQAHLHLCFDGQEPPTSVHWGDVSGHPHGEPTDTGDAEHDDLDLKVGAELLKSSQLDLHLFAPLLAAVLLSIELPPANVLPPVRASPPPEPLYLLNPPLRGPPA